MLLLNPNIHYHVHQSPPLDSNISFENVAKFKYLGKTMAGKLHSRRN